MGAPPNLHVPVPNEHSVQFSVGRKGFCRPIGDPRRMGVDDNGFFVACTIGWQAVARLSAHFSVGCAFIARFVRASKPIHRHDSSHSTGSGQLLQPKSCRKGCQNAKQATSDQQISQLKSNGDPNGSRTRVAGVKGRCPRPLDDGDPGFLLSYLTEVLHF